MSGFADQTVYSGIITLVAIIGLLSGVTVAVINDYRLQHPR